MDTSLPDEPVASLPRRTHRGPGLQTRLGLVLWLGLAALVLALSAV